MAEVMNTNKPIFEEAIDKSKQTIAAAKEKIENAAGYVADQSKKAVAAATEGVSQAASYVGNQAENATEALSGGLKSTAQSIRQNVPQEGHLGEAAYGVAQTFSNAAGYLDREGLNGIANDLGAAVKKNPLASVIAGIGVGFFLARASHYKR